jgi:hypothetical protein
VGDALAATPEKEALVEWVWVLVVVKAVVAWDLVVAKVKVAWRLVVV